MGVCASLAACLCFLVCLCLLCFEANKYDDDDDVTRSYIILSQFTVYRRATRATAMGNMHTSYKAMVYTIIYIYRLHPAVVTL